jgi:hypothetical protein
MASIIPGYEYDIFISYRHNDNRSGWVTEFVAAFSYKSLPNYSAFGVASFSCEFGSGNLSEH